MLENPFARDNGSSATTSGTTIVIIIIISTTTTTTSPPRPTSSSPLRRPRSPSSPSSLPPRRPPRPCCGLTFLLCPYVCAVGWRNFYGSGCGSTGNEEDSSKERRKNRKLHVDIVSIFRLGGLMNVDARTSFFSSLALSRSCKTYFPAYCYIACSTP